MSRSKHTEAAIIAALKQVEAGRTAEDVAREQGVSKHTIYAWKAKHGGMEVSEAEEVKQLRDESVRLKKLVGGLKPGQAHAAIGDKKKLLGLVAPSGHLRLSRLRRRSHHDQKAKRTPSSMRLAASAASGCPKVEEESTVLTAVTLVWFSRLELRALKVRVRG